MKRNICFCFILLFALCLSGCSEVSFDNVEAFKDIDPEKIGCKANLKMISVSKIQVSVEYGIPDGEEILQEHISNILGAQFSSLECPNGGTYSINPAGKNPTCSVHGDLLPLVRGNMIRQDM